MNFKLIKSICLLGVTLILTAAVVPWCAQPTPTPVRTPKTTEPTAVPTVEVNYDFGLTMGLTLSESQHRFITGDWIGLTCTSKTNPELNQTILWSFQELSNNSNATTGGFVDGKYIGNNVIFLPNPAPINIPSSGTRYEGLGRNCQLSYKINTKLLDNGRLDFESLTITQDNLSELKQEYVDFGVTGVPASSDFDQDVPGGLGEALLSFGDGYMQGLCTRHQYWMVGSLWENAQPIYTNLYILDHITLNITCGYRCPAGNRRCNGATNSPHMLGLAFDWDQGNNDEPGSVANWSVAKYIKDNQTTYLFEEIILYDQFEHQYSFRRDQIYDSYDERGQTVNPQTGELVDVQYTHGHVDWLIR